MAIGNYRDADGLRAAMRRCSSKLAAKVLANEYRRACSRYPSSLRDPLWLKVDTDLQEMPGEFFVEFMRD